MSTHITHSARGATVTYSGPNAAREARDAAGDLGVTTGPIDAAMIQQIVARDGGTGRIAEQMGYTKGTKEYKSAQRAIQRHQKGTMPTSAWKLKYERILGQQGTVSITVEGEIQAYAGSDDIRDHCEKTAPRIVGNVSDALKDPMSAWQGEIQTRQFNPVVRRMDSITISYVRY